MRDSSAQCLAGLCNRLSTALLDNSPIWIDLDSPADGPRNMRCMAMLPELLARFCLHGFGSTPDTARILSEATCKLAEQVVSVPFQERLLRQATFLKLSSLHDHISNNRDAASEQIMRKALKPLQWMQQEAEQMAMLASKRQLFS